MTTGSMESSSKIAALASQLEERLQAGRMTLPVMPEVALRVQQAASQRGVGARQLAQIVETSPGLTARLLRMTNSAMFQGMTEITDLSHAIGRLGTTMVVAVALGAAAKETFRSEDPAAVERLKRSWRASIHASAASRHLAPRWGLVSDEAFVGSLLHAVGEPVLCQQIEQLVKGGAIDRPSAEELADLLDQMRPAAGAHLLSSWGLPRCLTAAVQYHENPGLAPADCRINATVTSLAAHFGRRRVIDGHAPETIAEELGSADAVIAAGLDPLTLEPMLEQAGHDGDELDAVFARAG